MELDDTLGHPPQHNSFAAFEAELNAREVAAQAPQSSPAGRRGHRGNVRGTKLHPQPISRHEFTRMLEAVGGTKPRHTQTRAILVVLYRAMLRADELVHLRVCDVDRETGDVRVMFAKGGKARTVALDEKALDYVAEWAGVRSGLPIGQGTLFCTLQGRTAGSRLTTTYIRELIPSVAAKAGVAKRVHPHGLRHSGACEMRKAGIDIGIISKALGHSSIATTARYLDHIVPVDVLAAMRGMKW